MSSVAVVYSDKLAGPAGSMIVPSQCKRTYFVLYIVFCVMLAVL